MWVTQQNNNQKNIENIGKQEASVDTDTASRFSDSLLQVKDRVIHQGFSVIGHCLETFGIM